MPLLVATLGELKANLLRICGFQGNHGLFLYMGISKNIGTPKSSILIGFSIINHPFWGTPLFGNTHIYIIYYIYFFFFWGGGGGIVRTTIPFICPDLLLGLVIPPSHWRRSVHHPPLMKETTSLVPGAQKRQKLREFVSVVHLFLMDCCWRVRGVIYWKDGR